MVALQHPSLFGLQSSHCAEIHNDSMLGQLFLNLNACCLIVYTHLLPDREQFSVDPVFCIFLMILVTLARLVDFHISRLSIFVQDKILPYGDKQFFFLYMK